MILEKFNKLQENSQAHTIFKLDWSAYAALDFADIFLPDVKAYKGKAVYFYDGAELLSPLKRTPSQSINLGQTPELINTIVYSYPKGTEAADKKNAVQLAAHEVCVFIELDQDDRVEVSFKLGRNFNNFLNSQNIKATNFEDKTFLSDIDSLSKHFGNTFTQANSMQFVLNTLGISLPKNIQIQHGRRTPTTIYKQEKATGLIAANKRSYDRLLENFKALFTSPNQAFVISDFFKKIEPPKAETLQDDDPRMFAKIDEKTFKKAIKSLSEDQRLLARGYYQAINGQYKITFYSVDKDYRIPDELLISRDDKKMYAETTLAYHGGGLFIVNSKNGLAFLSDEIANAGKVTIADEKIITKLHKNDKFGIPNDKEASGEQNGDEVIPHEIIGHGVAFLYNKKADQQNQLVSIQVSNVIRRILKLKGERNGRDHDLSTGDNLGDESKKLAGYYLNGEPEGTKTREIPTFLKKLNPK